MKPLKDKRIISVALVLFACFASEASAQTIEKQALSHLEKIKAIRADADEKTVDGYNQLMNEAWNFFNANNTAVLPILRREMTLELQKAKPNDMLLLDVGYYLRLQKETSDKELGKAALFKLDPAEEVITLNQQQLFDFAFAVATDDDPRVLPFLDRAFLRQNIIAYVPPHALKLDETLVCVFLYGVYGQLSEAHLRNLLKDKAVAQKVLDILIWIGTPDSVAEVKEAMLAERNHETFISGTAFMMKIAGPKGRAFMLGLNPQDFDKDSQVYLRSLRAEIEATSYETLRKEFSVRGQSPSLSDDEVKKRLAAMYENYGKDNTTDPGAVLDSSLSRTFLTNELLRIRARMFRRLSGEALMDVNVTNSILNALQYREK
jgi:hypothetical protein